MTVNFRLLAPYDSKAYRKIRLESLKEFPASFSATWEESVKMEKLSIEADIEQQTHHKFVCGAFDNNELIGIGTFVKHKDGVGNIYQMYVQKQYQGQHIGMGLLRHLIKEAKNRFGEIDIFLEVSKHNLPAMLLYKKTGFNQEEAPEHSNIVRMIMKS